MRINSNSRKAVINWMLEDASLLELMGSIAAQGYFKGEPLIVVPGAKGRFTAVEGNRRLAAVLLLSDPELASVRRSTVKKIAEDAQFRPTELPCVTFKSREDVLSYLGYRHVTGIKEWEPLAKARYVEQLIRSGQAKGADPLAVVARKIGSKRPYLARLMGALALYEQAVRANFWGLHGIEEPDIDFSLITLALSYPTLRTFVGVTEDAKKVTAPTENVRDLFNWMFLESPEGTTVLGESRNMGQLAAIVHSPPALKALRSGKSMSDALLLTQAPLDVFRSSIRRAKEHLQTATLQLSAVRAVSDLDLASVEEVMAVARDLLAILRGRREGGAGKGSGS